MTLIASKVSKLLLAAAHHNSHCCTYLLSADLFLVLVQESSLTGTVLPYCAKYHLKPSTCG